MANFAVVWIRDGVLIDRMHVNAAAFAFSYWLFAQTDLQPKISIIDLVAFAFEKSGVSCAEKMELFNTEKINALTNVSAASGFYNKLSSECAKSCGYFTGIVNLLSQIRDSGGANYISSAVEQSVLDAWAHTEQGQHAAPYLNEIIGARQGLRKGREHFAYISERINKNPIYFVADARSEIETGKKCSKELNIIPVGFAHEITVSHVRNAVHLVQRNLDKFASDVPNFSSPHYPADLPGLVLPSTEQLRQELSGAGAAFVVEGQAELMGTGVRRIFSMLKLIS